jgi:hypothetical protein
MSKPPFRFGHLRHRRLSEGHASAAGRPPSSILSGNCQPTDENASQLATQPWNPGFINDRHARYAALYSMICGLGTWHVLWSTDCNTPSRACKKRQSIPEERASDERDLAFYKSGFHVSPLLSLYVRHIPRGPMALLPPGRGRLESMIRRTIPASITP